jgi:acetoin utilization protein AcuB
MLVRDIMSKNVVTVTPDTDLAAMREIFERTRFHHLLVVENGGLVGVISDRDLLRCQSPFVGTLAEREQDRQAERRRAHQLMTRNPIVAHPEDEVQTAAFFMVEKKISCLPVVDGETGLQGIVTWRDLLRAVAVHK